MGGITHEWVCVQMIPRASPVGWTPGACSRDLFDHTAFQAPFPFHLTAQLPFRLPVTSQINCLYLPFCFKVHFWENPTKMSATQNLLELEFPGVLKTLHHVKTKPPLSCIFNYGMLK